MPDTIIIYTTNCYHSDGPTHTALLAQPVLRFYIRPTAKCGGGHETHLDFGQHTHVHIVNILAPGDQVTLCFPWRTKEAEQISISTHENVIDEIVDEENYQTSFVLKALPGDGYEWWLGGGSPGFTLRVRVKRL